MKKETIEEAAERYARESFVPMRNSQGEVLNIPPAQTVPCGYSKHKKTAIKHFISGAKCQEQIADDFAMGFAEWLRENYYDNGELWTEWNSDDNTHSSKELLQIYKKEKGL